MSRVPVPAGRQGCPAVTAWLPPDLFLFFALAGARHEPRRSAVSWRGAAGRGRCVGGHAAGTAQRTAAGPAAAAAAAHGAAARQRPRCRGGALRCGAACASGGRAARLRHRASWPGGIRGCRGCRPGGAAGRPCCRRSAGGRAGSAGPPAAAAVRHRVLGAGQRGSPVGKRLPCRSGCSGGWRPRLFAGCLLACCRCLPSNVLLLPLQQVPHCTPTVTCPSSLAHRAAPAAACRWSP